MRKYIKTASDGRVINVQDCVLFPDNARANDEMTIPDNITGNLGDYRIINGEWVYEPIVYDTSDDTDRITELETRVSALEENERINQQMRMRNGG